MSVFSEHEYAADCELRMWAFWCASCRVVFSAYVYGTGAARKLVCCPMCGSTRIIDANDRPEDK